ncbi:hypothetical protein ROZALSC1DRAFT_27826 [Rozella allomycis CSF55]|uniref:Nucleosome assembly protein (NAP) domain-containing protein n=1 Tax=Rozella allomycis (strain CSF55) TaxID=988480 RepID=A0A075AYK2_ROZAC|nr:Nucleosome assembly protein (NAP) domain-containing protein [Rozella allomycis CSF55]RKP20712.1 hypothetical protein ROZALSC1DRAFT_27826 [Rozella allomycis CSF55]|eukprot:EPZ33594.1 Nucleosome assembly protein (NAP) domain-containing protein [Rozella allomycis CSF55]
MEGEAIKHLEEFEKIEDQLTALDEEHFKQASQLEFDFFQKRQPLYESRRELIKDIEDFWPTVIQNHQLGLLCSQEDMEVISYMKDLIIEKKKINHLKVSFVFNENPFFSNEKLEKEYTFAEEDFEDAEPTDVQITEINWKEGQNLIQKLSASGSSGKEKESCTHGCSHDHHDDPHSFFEWFESKEAHIARLIAEDMYPNAFNYFAGRIDEEDEEFGDLEVE